MTKNIDYSKTSGQELKQYLIAHKDDQDAFYAYMDRRHSRPNKVSIDYDDPEWETKMIEAICLQINKGRKP
ncbi:MAG: hypothetical protein AB4041_07225 [Microcystaceae cyanobacterium]